MQFSKVLFIQALEQSDPQGQYIPYSTRQGATQRAKNLSSLPHTSSPEDPIKFLTDRADILWNFLSSLYPKMTQTFCGAQVDIPSFIVVLPAFASGLLINGLGTSQRVNLLNFPLVFLLFWNLGIYAMNLLLPLLKKDPTGPILRFLSTGVAKLANRVGKGPWQTAAKHGNMGGDWILQSTEQFMNLWWIRAHPLLINRARHLLHLGAACLALGIIFSMYFRGLVLDYQATWESTFLSPAQVHSILHGMLGFAAWLLNFSFPRVEDLAQLQAPGHGSAAPWIHMWALTGFAGIVLPRTIFAWVSARSVRRAAESFTLPLDEPYYLQLLATDRGRGIQIDIIPYSYQPSPKASAFLGKCLLDLIGNQATLHWREPLPYGQESFPWLIPPPSSPQILVLVCNLAQTPEAEVHGELIHALQTQIEVTRGPHQLLLMLDQEFYQVTDPVRLKERQQTWQRLVNEYHLQIVPFDVKATPHDQLLQKTQAALWPSRR